MSAILYILAVPLVIFMFFKLTGSKSGPGAHGGGMVVGVVGRMGSGKSMFAVRMAYKRLMAGANVASNFSMTFDHLCAVKGCEHEDKDTCVSARLASRWRRFVGWEQIVELEDCVVIVDEAHLYAPSNKGASFPDDARWKLSMARKYRIDLYWITQHEARVNSVLKDLTNMMFVCNSWFGAAVFTAKGYEPENMRRKDKHIQRVIYRFNAKVAKLYNTLEILEADGVHVGKGTRINELAQARNAKLGVATSAVASSPIAIQEDEGCPHVKPGAKPKRPKVPGTESCASCLRCEHERKARKAHGWCQAC